MLEYSWGSVAANHSIYLV